MASSDCFSIHWANKSKSIINADSMDPDSVEQSAYGILKTLLWLPISLILCIRSMVTQMSTFYTMRCQDFERKRVAFEDIETFKSISDQRIVNLNVSSLSPTLAAVYTAHCNEKFLQYTLFLRKQAYSLILFIIEITKQQHKPLYVKKFLRSNCCK